MPKHYVCTGGCGGVSAKPGVCAAPDCPHHGKPLEPCDCADGTHGWATDDSEELSRIAEEIEEAE